MEMNQLIQRLNELYHQSKAKELNEVELVERDGLRKEYLDMIRHQVKGSLDQIEIVDPEVKEKVKEKEHDCDGNCNCGSECTCHHEH